MVFIKYGKIKIETKYVPATFYINFDGTIELTFSEESLGQSKINLYLQQLIFNTKPR